MSETWLRKYTAHTQENQGPQSYRILLHCSFFKSVMENKPASAGLHFFRMWHVCLVRSFGFSPVALDLYGSLERLVSLLVIHIHEKCEKCHIPNQVPFE